MTRRSSLAAIPKDEIPVANPGDYQERATLFRMWFGQVGTFNLYVWTTGRHDLETAFEVAVDFLDEHEKCGFFDFIDDSDYRAAAADLGLDWDVVQKDSSSDAFNRVTQAAEADMTLIGHTTLRGCDRKGQPAIPNWEWGGDEVSPSSDEYKLVERACKPRIIPITYDTVTPESAEEGDFADSGEDGEIEVTVSDLDEDEGETFAEHAAKLVIEELGYVEPSESGSDRSRIGPRWYTQSDGDENYSTGEVTRRSMHFDDKNGWDEDDRRAIYAELRRRKMVS